MTLEEMYYLSQIIAVFLILGSLAAVYRQVRQTKLIARAELTHNVWMTAGQMLHSLADTPEKTEFMHRALVGNGQLSGAEQYRLQYVLSTAMGVHEAAFNLKQRGLMEAGTFNSLEAITRSYLRASRFQDWWVRRRNDGRDPDYVARVDDLVAKINAKRESQATREGPLAEI